MNKTQTWNIVYLPLCFPFNRQHCVFPIFEHLLLSYFSRVRLREPQNFGTKWPARLAWEKPDINIFVRNEYELSNGLLLFRWHSNSAALVTPHRIDTPQTINYRIFTGGNYLLAPQILFQNVDSVIQLPTLVSRV